MRLYTFIYEHNEQIGIGFDEKTVYPIRDFGLDCPDMNTLIDRLGIDGILALKRPSTAGLSLDSIRLCAPIPTPKQDVLCLGINYLDHSQEAARFSSEAFEKLRPDTIYFSKRVNRAPATGEAIPSHSDIVDSLDYEVELAVIVGKDACNVPAEKAFDYILGYTVLNDVSARNLQTAHKQWYFGKSLDGFTPMGPCIVTADEFAAPPELGIRCTVNGELRQNSNTRLLISGIAPVIAELSAGMTLRAGTIIATGTPAGVGMGMQPPAFLLPGDEVCCEIEGIGQLVNRVQ